VYILLCHWPLLQSFHEVGEHWVFDRSLVKRLSDSKVNGRATAGTVDVTLDQWFHTKTMYRWCFTVNRFLFVARLRNWYSNPGVFAERWWIFLVECRLKLITAESYLFRNYSVKHCLENHYQWVNKVKIVKRNIIKSESEKMKHCQIVKMVKVWNNVLKHWRRFKRNSNTISLIVFNLLIYLRIAYFDSWLRMSNFCARNIPWQNIKYRLHISYRYTVHNYCNLFGTIIQALFNVMILKSFRF